MRAWHVLVPVAAIAGLAVVVATQQSGAEGLLRPDDSEVVARGAEIYAAQCTACHGAGLEGQPDWRSPGPDGRLPAPPHDETGHTWHHPDVVLFQLTNEGLAPFAGPDYDSAMPAFGGVLSDEEIVAVLSYIKAAWPERIQRGHDEVNANAQ